MKWLILLLFVPQLLPALETMPKAQWEFVSKYCTDCHDEDMYEGNVNLDFEKVNWQSAKVRKHWDKAYTMLERGKMPPKSKKKQPTSEELRSFMLWLDQKLMTSSPVGGTAIRRLNHREYRSTVQSVFGIKDFKLPGSFPKDINSHGFDTEAKMLVISPSHFESYTEAAVKVADYLFPPQKEAFEPREWNIDPKDMTISYSSAYIVDGAMRLASTGSKTRNGSWPTKFETPVSGKYKVTVVLSTFNPPKNKQPVFNLKSQKNGRGSSERDLGKFTIKEGAPQKFEVEVVLYRGETLLFLYENSPYNYGNKNGFKKFLAKEFVANPKLAAAWAKLGKVPRGGIGWERLKKTMAEEELDAGKFKPGSKALEKLLGSMDKNPVNTGETLVYKYFEEGPNIGIHNVQIEGPLEEIEDQEIKRQETVQNKFLGTYDKTDGEALTSFVRVYLEKAFRRQVQDSEVSKYV
ncbi:MAG: DUF1587 domain-containing protein, partial [Lentisphaeraceae bacterium]|nr:DUF1587 domain-containing protein [Lentisphaeraceae bacterium]